MESTEKETTEGLVEKMDEITNELVEKITEGSNEADNGKSDPAQIDEAREDEYDAKIERLLRLFYDRNNYSEFEFGGRLMDMLNATDRFDPKFVIELKAFAEEIKIYSSTTEDAAIIELIENL